jgi:hypothetical protein
LCLKGPAGSSERGQDRSTDLPTSVNLTEIDDDTMQTTFDNSEQFDEHVADLPPGKFHHLDTSILRVSHLFNVMNLHSDDNEDNQDEEDEPVQIRKYVSAREYYCFKLMIRKKLFNIVLFGGRLFQQWAVDMYIKIETMRLDWYSKPENQKIIRADLYQVPFLGLFLYDISDLTFNI